MTLFSVSSLKPKSSRPVRDKRPRSLIPTGAPRLVESSNDRAVRATTETWEAFLEMIRRSASARLALLEGWVDRDWIACPWERITGCSVTCRCSGTKTVTVEFLRKHYECLSAEIVKLTSVERLPS